MIWFSAYDFPRIKANNWQVGLHKMKKSFYTAKKTTKTTTKNGKKEPTEWETLPAVHLIQNTQIYTDIPQKSQGKKWHRYGLCIWLESQKT